MWFVHIATLAMADMENGWYRQSERYDRDVAIEENDQALIKILAEYEVYGQMIAFFDKGRLFHGYAVIADKRWGCNLYVVDEENKVLRHDCRRAEALVAAAKVLFADKALIKEDS